MTGWPLHLFVGFVYFAIIAAAILYRRARPAKPCIAPVPTIAMIVRPGANIRLAALRLPRKAQAT